MIYSSSLVTDNEDYSRNSCLFSLTRLNSQIQFQKLHLCATSSASGNLDSERNFEYSSPRSTIRVRRMCQIFEYSTSNIRIFEFARVEIPFTESRILFVRSEAGMLRPCGQAQSQDPKSDAQHLKELTGNITA
jgi:hypothetical protein